MTEQDMNPQTAELIERLTVEGSKAQLLSIPTEGLGQGLPASVPVVWDAKEQELVSLYHEMERYRLLPSMRSGVAEVTTLESFIELTKRHRDVHSVIFCKSDWPHPAMTAVLDYHEKGGVSRSLRHKISYQFPVTEELTAWIEGNAQPMAQGAFAAFLEDHAAELASATDEEKKYFEPLFNARFAEPNELVQLARCLEVHVSSKFKQGEILQSGERTVEFVEEHTDRNGEKVDIPGLFMVSVPAFLDGLPARIPARLRYRASSGQVLWFYQLYRWETALRDRVKADLEKAAQSTELPAFEGACER